MAIEARNSLSSCLSYKGHFTTFAQNDECHYRLLKFFDVLFDAIEVYAQWSDASRSSLEGIRFSRSTLRTIRDVLGLIHLFFDVIPTLIYSFKMLGLLGRSLFTPTEIVLIPNKPLERCLFNEKATNSLEKALCCAAIALKCLKSLSGCSTTLFCRLLIFFSEQGILLTKQQGGNVAKAYHILALLKHTTGFLSLSCEISFHLAAIQRAQQNRAHIVDLEPVSKKILELSCGLIEHSLLALYEGARSVQQTTPPYFRLPLLGMAAAISLYRLWLKTA